MKSFDVFEHPTDGREAVKDGFSWPGFFFKWFWAFVKGLPAYGFLFIGATALVWSIDRAAGVDPASLISELTELSLALWVGREGNEWRRKALVAKGYRWIGTVMAASPEAAIEAVSGHQAEKGELARGPANGSKHG
jgi:hypothetical protein